MKLKSITTQVPDGADPSTPRDPEGGMTSEVLTEFGRAAVDIGTPDRGHDDEHTDAINAIAKGLVYPDSAPSNTNIDDLPDELRLAWPDCQGRLRPTPKGLTAGRQALRLQVGRLAGGLG